MFGPRGIFNVILDRLAQGGSIGLIEVRLKPSFDPSDGNLFIRHSCEHFLALQWSPIESGRLRIRPVVRRGMRQK